jgi:heme/copper-type cytochrome/quinol oxidase subunit 2
MQKLIKYYFSKNFKAALEPWLTAVIVVVSILGFVLLVLLCILIIFCCLRRRQRKDKPEKKMPSDGKSHFNLVE